MNVYSKNTIAAFTVQLAHEIDLGTDIWEVGISNYHVPLLTWAL